MPNKIQYGLVADIGGTNARFALIDCAQPQKLLHLEKLRCADYASFDAAVMKYFELTPVNLQDTHRATLAVAGTVQGDWFEMTNNPWSFSLQAMQQTLHLAELALINDFTAIAWSIPQLQGDEAVQIGQGEAIANKPIGVLGPGTGLGISACILQDKNFIALETEGGHSSFAPNNTTEIKILEYLLQRHSRVSNERLLSGPGLENIYQALAAIEQKPAQNYTAADITAAALAKTDPLCIQTLNQFFAILGSVAGDLALTLGAKGGIYIAGGIVPRLLDFMLQSPFRQHFTAKGRFSAYNAAIPTRVITASQPGLLGAAAYLAYHKC